MGRILGLDYGEKTIGVAVSDPLNIIARGVEIVRREQENSFKKSILRIREIIRTYDIDLIVLGYPKNMDNTEGPRCQKTVEFKERLGRNFKSIPVILQDERLTTVSALRDLNEAGLNKEEKKAVIDKMAAVYILQAYLDGLAVKRAKEEN